MSEGRFYVCDRCGHIEVLDELPDGDRYSCDVCGSTAAWEFKPEHRPNAELHAGRIVEANRQEDEGTDGSGAPTRAVQDMNDTVATCGHEARTADGGSLRCLLPRGHTGLHDEPFQLRDGRIEHTNWGDDGLAFWVTSDKKRLRESRGTL